MWLCSLVTTRGRVCSADCNKHLSSYVVHAHLACLAHACVSLLAHAVYPWPCLCILPAHTRYPNKQQQELFFRHYMAEDAAMQQQHEQSRPKRGPFAWLQRLQRHKHSLQQQAPLAPQQEQQQWLHRLGSMQVPSGASSSSSSLPPLAAATLDELSASANVWALASHLYWGIWAIIQVRGVCSLLPCP